MKKILIIEDEQDVLDLLEMILDSEGYSTTATADPNEAVALAKRDAPDLVLCDIAMPETDGYAVLEALQADPATADFPIMFSHGSAPVHRACQGLPIGSGRLHDEAVHTATRCSGRSACCSRSCRRAPPEENGEEPRGPSVSVGLPAENNHGR